jgi:hypothetical protein
MNNGASLERVVYEPIESDTENVVIEEATELVEDPQGEPVGITG